MNNDYREHGPEGECKGKANEKHMVWMTRGRKQGVGSAGPGAPHKGFTSPGANCFQNRK